MKKTIFSICILLIIILLAFIAFKTNEKREQKREFYQNIPSFTLQSIENQIITEKSLQQNLSTLFLYFNPECELCVEELRKINTKNAEFSSFQIVFFTGNTLESVQTLLTEINFLPSENIFFLIDKNAEFSNKMQVRTSPTAFIYNRNGILVKKFEGMIKTETLLKYLSTE